MAVDPLIDLPEDIADAIRHLEQSPLDHWLHKPIPALGNRSVMEVHATPGGDDELREYRGKATGYFGG